MLLFQSVSALITEPFMLVTLRPPRQALISFTLIVRFWITPPVKDYFSLFIFKKVQKTKQNPMTCENNAGISVC